MIEMDWFLLFIHVVLAGALFFLVNWIGSHAIDFGYRSTSLFEEPNESLALNFFIRALSPSVFIIGISAIFVAVEQAQLRLGIIMVVPYYYLMRMGIIFLLNRQRLISWTRYIVHALLGIIAAMIAYYYLIVPNRSLIPDLESAGNELWLAILAFLYAVANKISLPEGPSARRRNKFVKTHYTMARHEFGNLIDEKITDDLLKLVAYSVLVYEDYCRPPAIRALERLAWWKKDRTTGIMQVSAKRTLSDKESVIKGLDILSASWQAHSEKNTLERIWCIIGDYNKDEDYIQRVLEIMHIIAERSDSKFKPAYNRMLA